MSRRSRVRTPPGARSSLDIDSLSAALRVLHIVRTDTKRRSETGNTRRALLCLDRYHSNMLREIP